MPTPNHRLSLLSPSVDLETKKWTGCYRIVRNLRYRKDGETMEKYNLWLKRNTVATFPKGETEKAMRAMACLWGYNPQ